MDQRGSLSVRIEHFLRIVSIALLFLVPVLGLAQSRVAATPDFVIFDVPNALGTLPFAMNNRGEIVGTSQGPATGIHGFLRAPDGHMTTIDFPGSAVTEATAINDRGEIAGVYVDTFDKVHAFLRDERESFTTIDPPNASFVSVASINDRGEIAGVFQAGTPSSATQGFIRHRDGVIIIFNPPDSISVSTTAVALRLFPGLNNRGESVGSFKDSHSATHGFFRDSAGDVTVLDFPGAVFTEAAGINNRGQIAGDYTLGAGRHGFLRDEDGDFTTFDPPGSAQTFALGGINARGEIAGTFLTASGSTGNHGFLRRADGSIVVFDPPSSQNTFVGAINDRGRIAGAFSDGSGVHGYTVAFRSSKK